MVSATLPVSHSPVSGAESTAKKRVVVADELGYCWGVRRALDIITDAALKQRPGRAGRRHHPQPAGCRAAPRQGRRGRPVGGRCRVARLSPGGDHRARHGSAPRLEAQAANVELIDTTCPLVTKVQRLAQKLVRQGYFLVVYGDAYHPEVKSVLGWAATSKAVAAKKISDLPWNCRRGEAGEGKVAPPRKVAVVSQTTKNIDELMKFAAELQTMVVPEGGEFRLCNTICEPTSERQNALKRLVERDNVDLILAIGGRKSSNTARLAEVGNSMGVPSHHIERPEDIQAEWLSQAHTVGVTAGASTPDDVIQDVVELLASHGFEPPAGRYPPRRPGLRSVLLSSRNRVIPKRIEGRTVVRSLILLPVFKRCLDGVNPRLKRPAPRGYPTRAKITKCLRHSERTR